MYAYDFVAQESARIVWIENPEIIVRIIRASNERQYMVHGIKNNRDFPLVKECGIKPLTLEGGPASYWNTGTRIFGIVDDNRLLTQDSALFRYAHSDGADENHRVMSLALACYGNVEGKKDCFQEDGYVRVYEVVPPTVFLLLRIELEVRNKILTPREYGQAAERLLLEELYDAVCNNFIIGQVRIKRGSV